MIRGMTGFGSAHFSIGSSKVIVELKSLNHRYLDVLYHLPVGLSSVENKIKQILQKEIERGRITVSVKFMQKPTQSVSMNKDAVKQYLKYGKQLKREFGLPNNITAKDVFVLPGVFEIREKLVSADQIWPALERSIRKSLAHLISMRKAEGRSLRADINDKLRRMAKQTKIIQARKKKILAAKKKVVTADEFSSYQKSTDINEEISRLNHYVDEIKKQMRIAVAAGKKIDFIGQEMQRETNTIGAKLQDKLVSNAVIALKSKIEKIREQAQNIE